MDWYILDIVLPFNSSTMYRSSSAKVHSNVIFTKRFNFNFPFSILGIPESPYIYFEVISKDYWDRYRTEGLTYKNIPVSAPGSYFYNLCCFRLRPQSLSSNLKRFFIGDCSNFNDITWIGLPKDFKVIRIH